MKSLLASLLLSLTLLPLNASAFSRSASLQNSAQTEDLISSEQNDFNPYDPNAAELLRAYDAQYQQDTGLNPILTRTPGYDLYSVNSQDFEIMATPVCYRIECPVFIDIDKSKQVLSMYINGTLAFKTLTSTGRPGFATPNFETNPNGRIYQVYSSSKYPGYNNMPFAIFIRGGFAIHGAPGSEAAQLGHVASHGCIRVKTAMAQKINQIVKQSILENNGSTQYVWISVH